VQYDKRIIYEAKNIARKEGQKLAWDALGGGDGRGVGIHQILKLLQAIPLDTTEVEMEYYDAYREEVPGAYMSRREMDLIAEVAARKVAARGV